MDVLLWVALLVASTLSAASVCTAFLPGLSLNAFRLDLYETLLRLRAAVIELHAEDDPAYREEAKRILAVARGAEWISRESFALMMRHRSDQEIPTIRSENAKVQDAIDQAEIEYTNRLRKYVFHEIRVAWPPTPVDERRLDEASVIKTARDLPARIHRQLAGA